MTFIDAIVVVLVVAGAWAGFRQGFITAVVSLLGAVFGALLALTIAPKLLASESEWGRTAIGLIILLTGILLGELLGDWAGRVLSQQITWKPAKAADRALGAVGQGLAVLALAWLVALPLASVPAPTLTSAVRNSVVLTQINSLLPNGASAVSAQLRNLLDSTGFPQILDPLAPTPITPVDTPDAELAGGPVAAAAQISVLKIRSNAPTCGKLLSGSGFVIGPERVLTNAHVVGGATRTVVETPEGILEATVVSYDADRDLAVLYVPGLTAPALKFSTEGVNSADDAIVIGYPGGGPYTASPARVRSEFDLRGPNIYGTSTVERNVYILRAQVRPGNSGGPLLDPAGDVIGVVFGSAIDDSETGFALTVDEVSSTVAAGLTDTSAAPTGACALH
ncbi:serine protease [Nakamurella antarctica]|uniref:Serine protease n=1 Tax=Nakamurella antarctica TaxID=1902245 RepID=A0A3G8ZIF0_9ACTN|nr:MarP family serine protease [Nakamurella antarctica]AZI57149.1 serine protease [Nakamurella antarctica]